MSLARPVVQCASLCALIGCGAGVASHSGPSAATQAAEVRAVGEEVGRLWNTGDTASLGRLLAPEFESYGATGQVRDKQAFLVRRYAGRRAGAGAPGPHHWTPTIRLLGAARDVAVLTYDVTDSVPVTRDAPRGVVETHLTDIYVKRDGRWLYVGFHESIKPLPSPAR